MMEKYGPYAGAALWIIMAMPFGPWAVALCAALAYIAIDSLRQRS